MSDQTGPDENSSHNERVAHETTARSPAWQEEIVGSDRAGRDDPAGRDQEPGPVRVGSPFAADPAAPVTGRDATPPETLASFDAAGYTAIGAVLASVMVLGFAGPAVWWFPAGATLIAGLGCALAIFGLFSPYRWTAATLLATHLSLFLYSYLEVIRG